MSYTSQYSNDESTDDECTANTKQAFEVEFSDDFNPNSIPKNGHEYLQQVIYERSRCKKLVTSNIDPTKFESNQTVCIEVKETNNRSSPKMCIPSKEWQHRAVRDFKYFRSFIESHVDREPTIRSFDEEKFIENIKTEPPRFSKILKYSQSSKIIMLQLIIKNMDNLRDGEYLNDSVGTWIFAILVLLQMPLSPNDCHILREFARKCLEIRSKFQDNVNEKVYSPLNFYISIVSNYFSQLDLAD